MERKRSAGSDVSTGTRSIRLSAKSPDPLPIPFRMHDPNEDAALVDSPESLLDPEELTSPEPQVSPLDSPQPESQLPALNGQLPTIHEASEGRSSVAGDDAHRPIPRRRSSLKRAGSISRLSVASQTKSVAWAMDRDWIEQRGVYSALRCGPGKAPAMSQPRHKGLHCARIESLFKGLAALKSVLIDRSPGNSPSPVAYAAAPICTIPFR